jgi:uncharacterized protein
MAQKFLTAEWRKLILVNYIADENSLRPFLPPKTEFDYYNGHLYVSLVGFMFLNTRVLGIRIPFHVNFPEVNLRMYVKHKDGNQWKRGVVFIKEIVPRAAISFVANTLFNERYSTMPMRNFEYKDDGQLSIGYLWKHAGKWNKLEATADPQPELIKVGSKQEFITQHFWGYSIGRDKHTNEYEVAHPLWQSYGIRDYVVDADFEGLYGTSFGYLSSQKPASVMLAEGSAIQIFNKRKL